MVYDRRGMPALTKATLQPPLVGGSGWCAEAISALAVGAEHHSARAGMLSPRLGPSSDEGSASLHQRSRPLCVFRRLTKAYRRSQKRDC